MKKFKRWWLWLFPVYIWVPVIVGVAFNTVGYMTLQHFKYVFHFRDFSIGLDNKIPFVPWMIIIYIMVAYTQWVIGFITCAREGQKFCYRFLSAEIVAKALCFLIYLIIPTTIVRPEIQGHGFILGMVRRVYSTDAPMNLFPSIHCLESWFCFRAALSQKKTGRVYPWITFIASLMVFSSVVLVKQHVLVDIIGGILIFEVAMLLTRKHDLSRFYIWLDRKIFRGKHE